MKKIFLLLSAACLAPQADTVLFVTNNSTCVISAGITAHDVANPASHVFVAIN